MCCEGNFKLRSHNTSDCLLKVVTKAGLIVFLSMFILLIFLSLLFLMTNIVITHISSVHHTFIWMELFPPISSWFKILVIKNFLNFFFYKWLIEGQGESKTKVVYMNLVAICYIFVISLLLKRILVVTSRQTIYIIILDMNNTRFWLILIRR